MGKNITITMHMDKVTENTIRFAENVPNEFVPEKIGGIYVQKFLLEQNGYNGGEIIVKIGTVGDVKFLPPKDGVKKTTVLFEESVADDFHAKRIGKIYVPKSTLAELGYTGDALYLSVAIAK